LRKKSLWTTKIPSIRSCVKDCRLIQDLPFHHQDPFDRMLDTQALNGGFTVIGSDERFDDDGV